MYPKKNMINSKPKFVSLNTPESYIYAIWFQLQYSYTRSDS